MFSKSSNYPIFFTLPILLYFGYTFYNHLDSYLYMSGIDNVDFYIHEFGHILFSIFGNEFLSVAGGTLLQLIIPISMLLHFWYQRDYFAMALSYAWVGTNFFYISTYSGDAIKMELPLISMGGGGNVIHDWYYMFTELGILRHTDLISNIFYGIAVLLFLVCFIYSAILIYNRFKEGSI